jgi:hypothetical protein
MYVGAASPPNILNTIKEGIKMRRAVNIYAAHISNILRSWTI